MKLTEQQEIDRGQRAKAILEDPLFVQAFDEIKAHLQRKWAGTALNASDEREQYYLQLALLEKLRGTLTYYIQNGTVQVFKLEERRKSAERSKRAV